MSETEAPAPSAPTPVIEAADVLEYLREHRDFFLNYPEFVPLLNLPSASGPVSISGGLANVLRQRNSNLRIRLQDLEDNARNNELLFKHTRAVSLALIDAQTADSLESALRTVVAPVCNAHEVAIYLPPRNNFGGQSARQKVGSLLRRTHPPAAMTRLLEGARRLEGTAPRHGLEPSVCCAALRERELDELFPLRETRGNGSAALITLDRNAGTLALGSSDSAHFDPDRGMLFLGYIGELIDHALDRIRR